MEPLSFLLRLRFPLFGAVSKDGISVSGLKILPWWPDQARQLLLEKLEYDPSTDSSIFKATEEGRMTMTTYITTNQLRIPIFSGMCPSSLFPSYSVPPSSHQLSTPYLRYEVKPCSLFPFISCPRQLSFTEFSRALISCFDRSEDTVQGVHRAIVDSSPINP